MLQTIFGDMVAGLADIELSDTKYAIPFIVLYYTFRIQVLKIQEKYSSLIGDKALETTKNEESIRDMYQAEIQKIKDDYEIRLQQLNYDCSLGACKGDTAHCRFTIINKQMDMVRSHLEPLKVKVKESFCIDLKMYAKDNPDSITDFRRQQIEGLHTVLIDAAFFFGEHEIRLFLRNEKIPREGTTKQTTETRLRWEWEKFNLFTGTIWGYVGKYMDDAIYVLSYQDRKAIFDQGRQLYFAQFQQVIKSAHAISLDPNGLE